MSYKNLQELNDAIIEFAKAVGTDYSNLNKSISILKQKIGLTDLNLVSEQLTAIINNFNSVSDTKLQSKLIELQNSINAAAAAGAGANGWTDLLVQTQNGRTQAEKNADSVSVKDFGAKGDSHPTRVRGLKHIARVCRNIWQFAPHTGAWIETTRTACAD